MLKKLLVLALCVAGCRSASSNAKTSSTQAVDAGHSITPEEFERERLIKLEAEFANTARSDHDVATEHSIQSGCKTLLDDGAALQALACHGDHCRVELRFKPGTEKDSVASLVGFTGTLRSQLEGFDYVRSSPDYPNGRLYLHLTTPDIATPALSN